MFNEVSLSQLIQRIRQRADMVDTLFVTDEEITGYCNESLGELYDLVIGSAAQEYFMRSCQIYEEGPLTRGLVPSDAGFFDDGFMVRNGEIVAPGGAPPLQVGDGTYALLPPDFYKLLGVDANVGQEGVPWKLTPYNFNRRDNMAPFNGSWQKGLNIQYRLSGKIAKVYDRAGDPSLPALPPEVAAIAANAPGIGGSSPSPSANVITHATTVGTWSPQRLYFTPNPPSLSNGGPSLITVWYIPLPPRFLFGTVVDPQTEDILVSPDTQYIPGFAHWDEYLTIDVAMRVRDKEESEVQLLMAQKQQVIQRILAQAPTRDAQFPETVQDTQGWGMQINSYPWYWQNWYPGGGY